ncbi:translational GTPase TypA [Candidatus Microgenomates bacterium]|nr:translational GTPase TypA [Candidatus Microgenomates bacterium]
MNNTSTALSASIRNVAIIAHVDHGKTTLVDALLRQTQTKLSKEVIEKGDLIMDSNELERERGITIFSKNASVNYTSAGSVQATKINIVDTPGHADFGGEVERVLKLVDGCLLLVDAKEGPMPQTRFVLKQALKLGLKIIVVLNKIDRPDRRIDWVINKTFDLFVELGADEEAAFFPTVYSSSKNGLAGLETDLSKMTDITPIFDAILEHIPAPSGDPDKPLQILITSITADNFKGRIGTGRVMNGKVTAGQEVIHISREGIKTKAKLSSLMSFEGLDRVDAAEAQAGDIIALSGIANLTIGETIADNPTTPALPLLSIEEPTVKMTFSVNSSPFAGKEGEFKTPTQIHERLMRAAENDVALKIEEITTSSGQAGQPAQAGAHEVSGRGELHLAILIERLRREGYEFQVSKPQVIEKVVDGQKVTPFERVYIEVPQEFEGIVMKKMGLRHGKLQDTMTQEGITIMEFTIATKEFLGYRSEFITDTKGMGIINASFFEFAPSSGAPFKRETGSLVAHEPGLSKLYALANVQERGILFIGPGTPVYKGEVVGRNSRPNDISVNVCKEKHLTNHRSKGDGVSEHFNAPMLVTLESALEYIDDSELVEVTPKNIRIRKINLNGTK